MNWVHSLKMQSLEITLLQSFLYIFKLFDIMVLSIVWLLSLDLRRIFSNLYFNSSMKDNARVYKTKRK